MSAWRRQALGLKESVETKSGYDLVVVGGGYSGMGAAISAARMGCKVALLQDRGVLGGNGSSEVRVWAQGLIRRGKFPRIGEIVEEFADKATASPAPAEQFGDELKLKVVQAEKNIDLFLHITRSEWLSRANAGISGCDRHSIEPSAPVHCPTIRGLHRTCVDRSIGIRRLGNDA